MINMLRAAIIGLGTVSAVHYQAIEKSRNGQLVAVCDHDKELRGKFPGVPFYTDVETMLENETIDVVHVCLPHFLHYPITKLCVEKGVHVLQEKPLSMDFEEGLKTLEVAEQSDRKVAVCFQNRYNPTFQRLMEIVRSGEYGSMRAVKGLVAWNRTHDYYAEKPWRGTWEMAGGGTIINQAIHTLDLMQLVGGELVSCKAQMGNLTDYDIEVEDTAVANFTFEDGVHGFYMSTNAYAANSSVELEVILEEATLNIKDEELCLTDQRKGQRQIVCQDLTLEGEKSYYGASHSSLIQHFYDAIEQDTDEYVSVQDALPSMLMIDAMKKSSNMKRTVKMEELRTGISEDRDARVHS